MYIGFSTKFQPISHKKPKIEAESKFHWSNSRKTWIFLPSMHVLRSAVHGGGPKGKTLQNHYIRNFWDKKCATKVRFTWRFWLNCIALDRNCLYLKEFSYWNNFYYCEIQIENRGWPKAANNTVRNAKLRLFFPHFFTTHNSGKKFSARKRAEIFLTPLSCVMICQNPPPPCCHLS